MSQFDIVVIGAGIHGVGVAQAAAAAGYRVMVLEKNTIGSGTSSRSSKLIHGGLRYLESAQFSLVRKSLKERALLCKLAPELVKLQPFYIPVYKHTTRRPWLIRLGLMLYALLGNLNKNNIFSHVNKKDFNKLDGLTTNQLEKVFKYYDGQANDTELSKAVMFSAQQLGAELICHAEVKSIEKEEATFLIKFQTESLEKVVQTKIIINATGPWVNNIHQRVTPAAKSLKVDLIQGTHIILDVVAPKGIYYLEAVDQRAVFVMPYVFNGEIKTMVGTTETLYQGDADHVKALDSEVDYLLKVYETYFPAKNNIKVLHKFAGLRVLPKSENTMFHRPRDTELHWALPGLLTLYGGKLTAYRFTSESVVKKIKHFLPKRKRIAYTNQLFLTTVPE